MLLTDNGPQFVSKEACQISNEWEFEHRTSSTYYPQSNSKAESAVKVVKHLMTKVLADGRDHWLSLLELRNTPTVGMSSSPAQRLLSRRTKALLPIKDEMLRPELVTEASEQSQKKQERLAKYYDRGAIDLPELYPGDVVCMQPIARRQQSGKRQQFYIRLDQGHIVCEQKKKECSVKIGDN